MIVISARYCPATEKDGRSVLTQIICLPKEMLIL